MAYDQSVRTMMNTAGYDNSKIGYDGNSGNVTYGGQNFMKPQMNVNGTTYSDQSSFDQAHNQYQQKNPNALGSGQSSSDPSNTGSPNVQQGIKQNVQSNAQQSAQQNGQAQSYVNPYTQQISDIMNHLQNASNTASQPADVYNSPQYAAAQAAQARTSQLAMRQASESAAGAGLGHSTIMTDRTQRIQGDSDNYLQTQLVPQIMSQMQAQKQQELQNQQSMFNNVYQLSNQADSQHNADRNFNAGRQDAATAATGYYNPTGQTVAQIQQIMARNSAEYASATPERQQELHNQNVALAGQFGSTDKTGNGDYSQGNGQVGVRTLAGQTADLNQMKTNADLTGKMPDGTLTNAAQQQQLANEWAVSDRTGVISPTLANMYGLPANTPTQAAKQFAQNLAIQQQQANTSAAGVANSFALGNRNADIAQQNADTNSANSTRSDTQQKQAMLMEEWKNSGKAPAGIDGVPEGTSLYDRTAAQKSIMDAYKIWQNTGKAPAGIPGVTEGTPLADKVTTRYQGMNDNEANITQQLDSLPKENVKVALQGEKSAIVAKVGTAGYQRIYNLYFDPITGAPK